MPRQIANEVIDVDGEVAIMDTRIEAGDFLEEATQINAVLQILPPEAIASCAREDIAGEVACECGRRHHFIGINPRKTEVFASCFTEGECGSVGFVPLHHFDLFCHVGEGCGTACEHGGINESEGAARGVTCEAEP